MRFSCFLRNFYFTDHLSIAICCCHEVFAVFTAVLAIRNNITVFMLHGLVYSKYLHYFYERNINKIQ